MKKKILGAALAFLMLFSQKVLADSKLNIEAKVNGTIDKGQKIQILINVKDIKSFFAGSMDFKYDPSVLKIDSIEPGDLISKSGVNKFDAINKVDAQSGLASYGFSCLGKINGFEGTGTFVKINAEVLKKDSFHINSKPFLKQPDNDMNLKLQIVDSNISEVDYQFTPYEFTVSGSTTNPTNNSSGSTGTSNNTAGGTANANNGTATSPQGGSSDNGKSDPAAANQQSNSKESAQEAPSNNQAVQNNKTENQGSSTTGQVKGVEGSNSRLYAYILIPSALLIAAGAYFIIRKRQKNKNNSVNLNS